MSAELQTKVLGLLYDQWFKQWFFGLSPETITSQLNVSGNDLSMVLEILESKYLIERDQMRRFKITISGVDTYEDVLPPSVVFRRVEQRRIVLETLRELYEKDTHAEMNNEELSAKATISDFFELEAVVRYLEYYGFVELHSYMGKDFHVRLTAKGLQSLQERTFDASKAMGNAYM